MDVLILGATGYAGSAIERAFSRRGHWTVGTARSDHAQITLASRGIAHTFGDAARPETIVEPVKRADAVVYCVQATDADPWDVDLNAIRAIGRTMAGTERTFIYLSSTWVYGETESVADESTALKPPPHLEKRAKLEQMVLNMVKIGIRGHVIRAGTIYGDGGGVPAMFVQSARQRLSTMILGSGDNHWATIGRDDLAALTVLIAERGKPGAVYNAVDDSSFTMREIAEAASRGAGAGGATTTVSPGILGPFGESLMLDQRISNARARNLGWTPNASTIVEDLEHGSYPAALIAS
jgi:nucleoside-diphosphate-sugar epimerase